MTRRFRRTAHRARAVTALDVVVFVAVLVALYGVVAVGRGTTVAFSPHHAAPVDTAAARLPYDAARSLLRMFVALVASYAFSLVYGYVAARSRRAERLLIPALDVLQSVPVLGFLSISVTGFVALFPGSVLGLELAATFAIFTSQAWNVTFAFYASLTSQPRDLDEAARLLGLSRWRRFWSLDVPNGAIPLVWNGMMSMGGGWFFLVASEAISVVGVTHPLPGVGSYAGAAIAQGDLAAVGLGVVTMAVMVIGVNVVFWRPLVAWAERFKHEQTEATAVPRSLVLDLLRRSHWPRAVGRVRRALAEPVNRVGDRLFGHDRSYPSRPPSRPSVAAAAVGVLTYGALAFGTWRLFAYVTAVDGWAVFVSPLGQGLVTFARVVVLVVVATVVWVPIGVRIGLDPKVARLAQPVVQVLASFPANFVFPFAVWIFLRTGLSLDLGGIVLMSLGAQWYILFNAIAGAQAIPSDLREAMDDLGVRGWTRWRRLYLPAVFPAYVTGGLTASGGAWNASIVAEVVTYGGTTLTATGLGAYITEATGTGDFHRVLAGIAVMTVFVVGVNRLVWHPLGRLADRRYALG